MPTSFSNVVAFDDFPFSPSHRGDITVVGVIYSGLRLDGIVRGSVRRDGANAASRLADLVCGSKYSESIQLILLQGIALGGFNVVDVPALSAAVGVPILVVARRCPDFDAVRNALLTRVPGGKRKWGLIESLGPMEALEGVWVQRHGLTLDEAAAVIKRFAVHGNIPEPLRSAHLIASGMGSGQSRGRT